VQSETPEYKSVFKEIFLVFDIISIVLATEGPRPIPYYGNYKTSLLEAPFSETVSILPVRQFILLFFSFMNKRNGTKSAFVSLSAITIIQIFLSVNSLQIVE